MAEENIPTTRLFWDKALGGYALEPAKAKRAGHFLKGPVPLSWLAKAAQLPGKASQVGEMLWYMAGVAKRRDGLTLPRQLREAFGVARGAYYQALARMEAADLVSVVREGKKSAVVTILNVEE